MLRGLVYRAGSAVGPLRTLRKRHEALRRSQSWDAATLAEHQSRLLETLLAHAAASVPFFRRHWAEHGETPPGPAQLRRWPVIDRHTLKAHPQSLRSERPHPRAFAYATGGSTGAPIELVIDPEVKAWRWAAKMRNLEWMGWRPGDRIAFIWGSDFDRKRTDQLATRLFRRLSN